MAARAASRRARMSAEQRRGQLIGIGLRLLVTRPIHELSVDEVADRAGISRGLLFHYFPTKHDYYVAVVEAAGRRLLSHARVTDGGSAPARVREILDGFVRFVRRRRANYVSLVRGSAGGDARVVEVFEDIRGTLAERTLRAIDGLPATPLVQLTVRGWLAMAEEMAIQSSTEVTDTDELVSLLLNDLDVTLRQATGDEHGLFDRDRPNSYGC